MEDGWAKWLENQGPLWVIYALTIVGIVTLVRQLFKYLPILFDKHLALLERTTDSVSKSSEAIVKMTSAIDGNTLEIAQQQMHISDAAKPFAKAMVAMANAESKDEVRQHLHEMENILARMKNGDKK
jgi:hypothetical protein